MFGPNGTKRLWHSETWIYFYDIPDKRSNQMWVDELSKPRPVVLHPGFQSRKIFFFYLKTLKWSCCRWHFAWKNYTDCHILCQNCSSQSHPVRAWPAPNGQNQQKPPSAWQCRSPQGQGHRIIPTGTGHPSLGAYHPTVPTLPPVTFGLFLNWRSGWQEGNVQESRTSQKPPFQSATLYLLWSTKMLFRCGGGGWNFVWPVEGCIAKAWRSLVEACSLVSVLHQLWQDFWVGPRLI